jgi:Zn-dependent protease with chaperone function
MKWITASDAQGRQIELSVDSSGAMLARSEGVESVLGTPKDFNAKLVHAGTRSQYAELLIPPFGTLRTVELDAVDAWFAHLDLSGERNKKRAPAWVWAWGILGTILLAIVLTIWLGLPWLARLVSERIPAEWEKSLAAGTLSSLESDGFKVSEVPVMEQARYRELFAKLTKGISYNNPVTLEFRSWSDPNAFAIPGGTIVVTDQMLKLMATDDEFMAVMAHEIGHLEKRHGIRSVLQQGGAWMVLSTLLGDSSGLANVANALPTVLIDSAYSRDFEREADEYAFVRLKAAGISPRAFASLMRKLQSASETSGPNAIKYFSSHPATDERIAAAEKAAQP